jgi:LPXTG-motif cell wall-anchored protein
MKKLTRTPWLGVFIVVVGASLCAPQVANALPGRAAATATPGAIDNAAKDPETCKATFSISGGVATVNTTGLCDENYLLVSYTAMSSKSFAASLPQHLFATSTGKTVRLPVAPTCFWQVDYIENNADDGLPIGIVDMSHRYGERLVAGRLGNNKCPPPTSTSSSTSSTTATTAPGKTSSSVLGNQFGNSTTTEPVDAAVLGSSTQALPRTGASHVGLEALMGLGLMALGGSVLVTDRRRRRLA